MNVATGGEKALALVADDEPDILALVSLRLREVGLEVVTARDGREALDLIAERPPDLLVLDVRMPLMDGYDVTRAVRAGAETRRIPILLLSASIKDEQIPDGFEAGADAYLRKPFAAKELQETARALLEGRRPVLGRRKDARVP